MMIPIYHDIVGRGMVMELAFSIDRDGLVEDTHAAVYKQLGDWVRACYGRPVSSVAGEGDTQYDLLVPEGAVADRVMLKEDTTVGQRVRNYTISYQSSQSQPWGSLAVGEAIGTKRIILFGKNITGGSTIRLTIQHAIAPPVMKQFGAFAPCPSG